MFFQVDYKIFRAVRILDIVKVVLVAADRVELCEHGLHGLRVRRSLLDLFARKREIKALEHIQKPASACVDDACLFEHGQHFGGLLQGLFALCQESLKEGDKRRIFVRDRRCMLRHRANDSEHGALFGLCHRAVCDLAGARKRLRERLGRDLGFIPEITRKSFYYLR